MPLKCSNSIGVSVSPFCWIACFQRAGSVSGGFDEARRITGGNLNQSVLGFGGHVRRDTRPDLVDADFQQ